MTMPKFMNPQSDQSQRDPSMPHPSALSSPAPLSAVARLRPWSPGLARMLGGMLLLGLVGCGGPQSGEAPASQSPADPSPDPAATAEAVGQGELELRANGEAFVRDGFTTKDGWEIEFDNVYVSLGPVEALQTDPPFDPDAGADPQIVNQVNLDGGVVDLASPEAETVLVGSVPAAIAGRYNAMAFGVVPAGDGPAPGQSFRLVGMAQKDGEAVAFTLDWDQAYSYQCGDFIGDQRKGILKAGDRADLEATFHFDHVFGDADTPADDALNQDALGFAPLASLAQDGRLGANREQLQAQLAPEDFARLDKAMSGLAHVGEGHCRKVNS